MRAVVKGCCAVLAVGVKKRREKLELAVLRDDLSVAPLAAEAEAGRWAGSRADPRM